MPPQITKFAPTAIVAALATWFCWPYLDGTDLAGGTSQESSFTKINASSLAPSIAGASGRDPFQPPPPEEADLAESDAPEETAEEATARGVCLPEAEGEDRPPDLVLQATCIRGNRRLALINGRLYAPGEAVTLARPAAFPYVVRKIFPHKVLIEHRGKILEVSYRNPAQKKRSDRIQQVIA